MGEWWDSAWSGHGGENETSACASVADRPYSAGERRRENIITFQVTLNSFEAKTQLLLTRTHNTMGQRWSRMVGAGGDLEMGEMGTGECRIQMEFE